MQNETSKFQDLGFGTKLAKSGERLIKKDGSFNIVRMGQRRWSSYHSLINMSTRNFLLASLLYFMMVNLFFTIIFFLIGTDQLNGLPEGNMVSDFLFSFFFSIQTFTTVGYGVINPLGIAANIAASICASVGMFSFAIITGLFLARFSRPVPHIAISDKALLTPYKDISSFQCRIVNLRDHKISNLKANLSVTWLEEIDQKIVRKYASLHMERTQVKMFPLNWTLVHPIDEKSILKGLTLTEMKSQNMEFLVAIEGFDESYYQTIHVNRSYICEEVESNYKFEPMYKSNDDGPTELFLDELSTIIPLNSLPVS